MVADLADDAAPRDEYERDTWDSRRLGIVARPPNYLIRFGPISQPWLRDTVKVWARLRLATGKAVSTVANDAHGLSWFSRFLDGIDPSAHDESVCTRRLLESYLSHLAGAGLADQTRLGYLASLRIFLEDARRHNFLATLPAEARLYPEDMPPHGEYLPRAIPESVMAQLESDANLARMSDPTTRHLVVVLMETGLRASDACNIPVDALVEDSVGWSCLRFYNSKVRTEQLVPLSPRRPPRCGLKANSSMTSGRRAPGSCSPVSGPTLTAFCRSPTPPWSHACAAGRPASTCATTRGIHIGPPHISSAIPSGHG